MGTLAGRESKGGRKNILSVGGHTCTVYRESEIHKKRGKEREVNQFSLQDRESR